MNSSIAAELEKLTEDRLAALRIKYGSHIDRSAGVCIMEAVAWLAGEPHSAYPACSSRIIGRLAITLNDRMRSDAEREALKPLALKIVGTRGSDAVEIKRVYMTFDWFVREALPENVDFLAELAALDGKWGKHEKQFRDYVAALQPHAVKLRALSPIVDPVSAREARAVLSAMNEDRLALDLDLDLAESFRQKRIASAIALIERLCAVV
jgi:hypothetical protein